MRVFIAILFFFALLGLGCVSPLPTDILLQSGALSDLANPSAICVAAREGDLAHEARSQLEGALRARGLPVATACSKLTPHLRIAVSASDRQMTTEGPVSGNIALEAQVEAFTAGRPTTALLLLRTSGSHLRPEVTALSETLRQLFATGSVPPRAVLVPISLHP